MKKLIVRLVLPTALTVGALGAGFATGGPVGAAERGHDSMAAKTWHGKVEKLNAPMGTTDSFNVKVATKTYTVHYDAMTHWVMGTKKDLKVGVVVTVKGTLAGKIITATTLSL